MRKRMWWGEWGGGGKGGESDKETDRQKWRQKQRVCVCVYVEALLPMLNPLSDDKILDWSKSEKIALQTIYKIAFKMKNECHMGWKTL